MAGKENKVSAYRDKTKTMSNSIIVLTDLLIAAVMLIICSVYVSETNNKISAERRDAFAAVISSTVKAAENSLDAERFICMDRAGYINDREMTVGEALIYLDSSEMMSAASWHIVDYDTLCDASSQLALISDGSEAFGKIAAAVRLDRGEDKSDMLGTYTDNSTGRPSAAFCRDITLTADGVKKHYLLMRSVTLAQLTEDWKFPCGYENAGLLLIDSSGDYIIGSDSFDTDSFGEYIALYSDPGFDRSSAAAGNYFGHFGTRVFRNSSGVQSVYVCVPSHAAGLYFVGYIPESDAGQGKLGTGIVMVTGLGLLLIFIADISYMIYIGSRLTSSMKEAAAANEAKTQFLASMSHDIRTPMNAIMGLTVIARRNIGDPEKLGDCLNKISFAGNHLLTLINDVLDISKAESGKIKLNPAVCSLSDISDELVNMIKPQIREKNQEFDMHTRDIVHEHILADELRISQIFVNLLTNSVKYTGVGGKITVDLSERMLPDDPARVELVYSVKDTGVGMSEKFMQYMYHPFTRAVDTRIDKLQGTGLGLAITKRLIDIMEGTIECSSEQGRGTVFTVRLPLLIAEEENDVLMLPPMTVLIADDDEIALESAKEIFLSLGIEPDLVNSGKKAVDAAYEKHISGGDYSVIILDWKMTGLSGVETARRLRSSIGSETPILVASAYDWDEIEMDAYKAGVNGFINKPLFRTTVYSKLSAISRKMSGAGIIPEENAADLRGKRILVAEDNDLNWEIVHETLGYYGIISDRAENGKICVDILKTSAVDMYDAVLMDIQMPVMNGRDACVEIRRIKDEKKRTVPVIAMTADAFAEDIQACFDAGMDGHIAKPVDLKLLFRELRKAGVGKQSS